MYLYIYTIQYIQLDWSALFITFCLGRVSGSKKVGLFSPWDFGFRYSSVFWSYYVKTNMRNRADQSKCRYILLCGLPLNNILLYFIDSSPLILSRCLGNGILQPSSKMIHHRDWNSICHQFLWFHNASK